MLIRNVPEKNFLLMVYSHWLSLRLGQGPETLRMGCMVLRLEEPFTLHLNRDREEWVVYACIRS